MNEDSLTHYGVLGMKWGRRKQKVSKGSNTKKSSKSKQSTKKASNIKKKIQKITSKVDKEKVKNIAKTTAKVTGKVAVASLLGYTGLYIMNELNNEVNMYKRDYKTVLGREKELKNQINEYSNQAVKNADAYRELKKLVDLETRPTDMLSVTTGPGGYNRLQSLREKANIMDFRNTVPVIDETLKLKRK